MKLLSVFRICFFIVFLSAVAAMEYYRNQAIDQHERSKELATELLQCADCCDQLNQEITRANLDMARWQAERDSAAAAMIRKHLK